MARVRAGDGAFGRSACRRPSARLTNDRGGVNQNPRESVVRFYGIHPKLMGIGVELSILCATVLALGVPMTLPAPSDPRWRSYLLDSTSRPALNFLALKIFLGRTEVALKGTTSDDAVRQAAQQFRELLEKNLTLPSVQKDVAALFGSRS